MADYKISQLTPVTPTSDDLLEVSHTTDSGVTYNTGSVSVDTLSSAVADNITAADIEYSSGVSVADKIDELLTDTSHFMMYQESIMSYLQGGVIVNQIDPSETPEHSAPSGELAVVFLKNSSDPETIGKKWSDANKVTGKLLYNNDIENIKLLVHGNFTAYNYCYIHELGRYYYINTFIIEKDGDFTVDMSVDVLQSFKDEILEIPALIDSAEDKSKAKFLMNNGYWYMKQNKVIKTLMFKKSGQPVKFNRDSSNEVFLLTIAGDTLD